MHPAFILIPAAALIFGPRLWVRHVLQSHDGEDPELPATGSEFARELLDRHDLVGVRVELTDMGDHYDPKARAVRLSRDRFDRQSLSAITTAAHEVSHALQHASAYPPFEWRARLAKVAQITGLAGTALLISVPAASLVSRRPLPPSLVGIGALGMLGTALTAQLAALPTEFDASFNRAMPMLREELSQAKLSDARQILIACSLTYLASSVAGALHVWPWLGSGRLFLTAPAVEPTTREDGSEERRQDTSAEANKVVAHKKKRRGRIRGGLFEATFRRAAKPLVREWLRYSR